MKNVSIAGIKQRRFDTIDRAQIRAKADIQAEEDRKIFDAINAAVGKVIPKGVVIVTDEEGLGRVFDPDNISVETLRMK